MNSKAAALTTDISRLLLVGALLLWVISCAPSGEEGRAKEIVSAYYQAVQDGRLKDAAGFYPDDMQNEVLSVLELQRQTYGALQEYNIYNTESNTVYSGKFYLFMAEARYARGRTSEIVTLLKKVSDDKIHVVSHKIDPD